MAYVAWNGQTYEGSPPAGWYYASDNRWWAPDTGPGPYKPESSSQPASGSAPEPRYDQYQAAPSAGQQDHQAQVQPTLQPPPLNHQAASNSPGSSYPAQSNSVPPQGGHQPDQNALRQSSAQDYPASSPDYGRPAPTQPLAGSYPGPSVQGPARQQTVGGSNKNLLIAGGIFGAIVLIGASVFLGSKLGGGDPGVTIDTTTTTESAQSTTTTESGQSTTTGSDSASTASTAIGTLGADDIPIELSADDFAGTGDEALKVMYDYYSSVFGSTDLNGVLEGLSPDLFPETDHPDDAALVGFSSEYRPGSLSRYSFQYVTSNSPDQIMDFYGTSLADFGISRQSDGSNETGAFKTMTSDKKTVGDYEDLFYTVTAQEANQDGLVVVFVESSYNDGQESAKDLGDGVYSELAGYLPLAKNFGLRSIGLRAEAGLFGFITLDFSHDGELASLEVAENELPDLTHRFQSLYDEVDPGWNTTYDENGYITAKHDTDKDLELSLSTIAGYKTLDISQSLRTLLDGDEFVNSIDADT